MENSSQFIGKGWSFPPHIDKNKKEVEMTTAEADINNSLYILLSTRPGERIMFPDYGCNLEEMLFQPLDTTLKTYIKDLIETAILYHEPRIDVLKIDIEPSNEEQGVINLIIDYKIRITNSRANMVFPFYKIEGTEI